MKKDTLYYDCIAILKDNIDKIHNFFKEEKKNYLSVYNYLGPDYYTFISNILNDYDHFISVYDDDAEKKCIIYTKERGWTWLCEKLIEYGDSTDVIVSIFSSPHKTEFAFIAEEMYLLLFDCIVACSSRERVFQCENEVLELIYGGKNEARIGS